MFELVGLALLYFVVNNCFTGFIAIFGMGICLYCALHMYQKARRLD